MEIDVLQLRSSKGKAQIIGGKQNEQTVHRKGI